MDFYDTPATNSQETLKQSEINKRTEETFSQLESEITKTYNIIETKASTWGSSFSSFFNQKLEDLHINDKLKDLHLNDKINETKSSLTKQWQEKTMLTNLTAKTNEYLDDLDKELEQVETMAGGVLTRFNKFIKDTIVLEENDNGDDEELNDEESKLLYNVEKGFKISANRTEAQLQLLYTSKDLYLSKPDDEFVQFQSDFNPQDHKHTIEELIKSNNQLKKISTELIPQDVSFDEFWSRYFFMFNKIKQQESNRKRILTKINNENINWDDQDDDDDDDDNNNDDDDDHTNSTTSNYELNSVDSSTLEVNKRAKEEKKEKKEVPKQENKQNEDDDEEDDDDWE